MIEDEGEEAIDVKRLKGREDLKVYGDVFEPQTLKALYKLANRRVFERFRGEISVGKEANVFLAEDEDGAYLALKIYRLGTADFRNFRIYIEGDPRFAYTGSRRKMVKLWTSKEYRNLLRLAEAGVRVPALIDVFGNVLAMEFIGTDGTPSRELRFAPSDTDWGDVFDHLIADVRRAYQKADLVHADLSEYNVLLHEGAPVIIDCGQAVLTVHPRAEEFLRRDVHNVRAFFSRRMEVPSEEDLMAYITGGESNGN